MGMPATEFKPIKEGATKEEVDNYLTSMIFRDYSMIVRARYEQGNAFNGGEGRFKTNSIRTMPIDLKEDNQALLRRLEMYKKK